MLGGEGVYLVHVPQEPGILVQDFLLEIRDEGVRGAEEGVFGWDWGGGSAVVAGGARGGGGVFVEGGHCKVWWFLMDEEVILGLGLGSLDVLISFFPS